MRAPIDLDYTAKAIAGIATPAVGVMSLVAMVRKWRGRWNV
ncbi:MAG TPA: hypothetical protein VLO11_03870 [Luteolibacter sp.]|nr:hypothetical protein [Luteolibacter sp.]